LLWRNNGSGDYRHMYENVSPRSGPVFNTAYAVRGLAIGDFNNDGAVDVLMIPNDGPPILLRNNVGNAITGWGFGSWPKSRIQTRLAP
jgi:hypothetical protein